MALSCFPSYSTRPSVLTSIVVNSPEVLHIGEQSTGGQMLSAIFQTIFDVLYLWKLMYQNFRSSTTEPSFRISPKFYLGPCFSQGSVRHLIITPLTIKSLGLSPLVVWLISAGMLKGF